jgi:hypothetical protein
MLLTLIPAVLGLVGKAIDKAVPDAGQAMELKGAIATQIHQLAATELQGAIDIILAEAQGESWLQRNWRPLLMLMCIAIITNNFILAPYLGAIFSWKVVLEMPDALWELLKIGTGGYIVGRSVEKGLDIWKNGGPAK